MVKKHKKLKTLQVIQTNDGPDRILGNDVVGSGGGKMFSLFAFLVGLKGARTLCKFVTIYAIINHFVQKI